MAGMCRPAGAYSVFLGFDSHHCVAGYDISPLTGLLRVDCAVFSNVWCFSVIFFGKLPLS